MESRDVGGLGGGVERVSSIRSEVGVAAIWMGEILNGGTFSLLESPSTTTVAVRVRFGFGVLSGVFNCSQSELEES